MIVLVFSFNRFLIQSLCVVVDIGLELATDY